MPLPRSLSRLPIVGLLAAMAAGIGWLLLVYAADRDGEELLPGPSAPQVEYVDDLGGRLTHDEVVRLAPEQWRRWSGKSYLKSRWGSQAIWARIRLHNPGDRPRDGVLESTEFFTDHVNAWVEDAAGEWREMRTGQIVPVRERPFWGREAAFPIRVPARGSCLVYLHSTDGFLPNLMPVWWPDAARFQAMRSRALLADALYFGGLLALLGYNLVLWLRLRLPDIGYYVFYLAAIGSFMFLVRARPAEFGWTPGAREINLLLNGAIVLSALFLTLFARTFLELPTRAPGLDRVAQVLLALLGLLLALVLVSPWWGDYELTGRALKGAGLTHVTLLGLGLWAWRRGIVQAQLFVLAFGFLFAGSLPNVLLWLTHSTAKNLTLPGLMAGSAMEMLVLSLAMADRFVRAQRERAEAQERLVGETEQRRAMQEAYADELELEVRERTRELEAANADKDRMLTLLGHDLRSPLTALTQTAERQRGGTGEPPAHFATEVSAAGRQMLLLIEDIVLWSRLRAGVKPAPAVHAALLLIEPAVRLHRPFAAARHVAVILDVPDQLALRTDCVLAQALVRNLVGNAVKFARSRVVVSAQPLDGQVVLAVRDDGPGLPADVAAAVQGGAAGERGLGLRLCREIGAVLGLSLQTRPVAGGGAEMSIILPAAILTEVPR